MQFHSYMQLAYQQAQLAYQANEVPVGCIIVAGSEIIAARNNSVATDNSLGHAELLAIAEASKKYGRFLEQCDLYVTLEPCAMCAYAISLVRIRRLYFGAYDPKSGGVVHGARVFHNSSCHHMPEVIGGIMEEECSVLLKNFFQQLR